jgi:hypothetical protein
MVWVFQKPTQNNRLGEVVEELPGLGKSVACAKRGISELGRSPAGARGRAGEADQKKVNRSLAGSQISP